MRHFSLALTPVKSTFGRRSIPVVGDLLLRVIVRLHPLRRLTLFLWWGAARSSSSSSSSSELELSSASSPRALASASSCFCLSFFLFFILPPRDEKCPAIWSAAAVVSVAL